MKEAVLLVFGVMAIVTAARPAAGLAFMWFAIWLYPVKAMYGALPLDIRLSDVWVLYMAALALARARTGWWRTPPIALSLLWLLAIVAGDLSGWALGGFGNPLPIVKDALKALYVPCTALSIWVLIQGGSSARQHLTWMIAGAAAAGALGILMVHFPVPLDGFLIPKDKLSWQTDVIEAADLAQRRAIGALGTPGLAQITMTGLLAAACLSAERIGWRSRGLHALLAAACYVGLLYTASRGALTAVAVTLLWSVFALRGRSHILTLAVVGVAILLACTPLLERVALRFSGEEGGLSQFRLGLDLRWEEVRPFITQFRPAYLLFGVGKTGSLGTTHNAYVGTFVYCGSFGLILLIAMIAAAWRSGRRLTLQAEPGIRALGTFQCSLVIAFAVYGLTAENFQSTTPMQVYFAVLALAVRHSGLHAIAPPSQDPYDPGISAVERGRRRRLARLAAEAPARTST